MEQESGINMIICKIDKKGRLVIPKEFREKLKIDESSLLAFEVLSQNAIKISLIQNEEGDYTSDPLWIAIHNPIVLPKRITSEDLNKLEDAQWST
jgi:AbrB family looped-hinge helix DNA binding protein